MQSLTQQLLASAASCPHQQQAAGGPGKGGGRQGTQFTRFTGTKVQILTQKALLDLHHRRVIPLLLRNALWRPADHRQIRGHVAVGGAEGWHPRRYRGLVSAAGTEV